MSSSVVEQFIEAALNQKCDDLATQSPWRQYLLMLQGVLETSLYDWEYVHDATFCRDLPEEAKCSRFWEERAVNILLELQSFGSEAIKEGEEIIVSWRENCTLWRAFKHWPAS